MIHPITKKFIKPFCDNINCIKYLYCRFKYDSFSNFCEQKKDTCFECIFRDEEGLVYYCTECPEGYRIISDEYGEGNSETCSKFILKRK